MPNPNIPQGSLNRLLAAVNFAAFPGLNVTSPYLAKEGVSIAFEGKAAMQIKTLTGLVNSPEVYREAVVTINLLKTQALGAAFKAQEEVDSSIGDISVIPDSIALGSYQIIGCVLEGVTSQNYDGNQPGFQITLRGAYQVNSTLWDLDS